MKNEADDCYLFNYQWNLTQGAMKDATVKLTPCFAVFYHFYNGPSFVLKCALGRNIKCIYANSLTDGIKTQTVVISKNWK